MGNWEYWIPLIASFVSGSVLATIFKLIVDARAARHQPIDYWLEVVPLLEESIGEMRLAIDLEGLTYNYDNMHSVEVRIRNSGNRDLASFDFGITMETQHVAIGYTTETSDRHHVATIVPEPQHQAPTHQVDVNLAPFNRRDTYVVRLNVSRVRHGRDTIAPLDLEAVIVSTAEPVNLRPLHRIESIQTEIGRSLVKVILGSLVLR